MDIHPCCEEKEMTTNDVFPLLQLPAGVETVLLPFVASGTGGLQSLLNLRLVCSTTKSWVDTVPPRQGKLLFSKAQVRMDSDFDTVDKFLDSPPSLALNALSVNIKHVVDRNPPPEDEELWKKFCALWAHRLEDLELRIENNDEDPDFFIFNKNRRILNLLESPNLKVLRLARIRIVCNQKSRIPSSLSKVKDLSINFIDRDGYNETVVRSVHLKLMKNPNLRKLRIFVHSAFEYKRVQKFIEAKTEDSQFQLDLHLEGIFPPHEWDDLREDEDDVNYLNFAESVIASNSKIQLHFLNDWNLENALNFLPPNVALELFKKVVFVENWNPSKDTFSLLENLPRLSKVKVQTEGYDGNMDVVTFPPSLKEVSFTSGFPVSRALPEALMSLTLHDFCCDVNKLVNSLTFLRTQLTNLETLNITWKCKVTNERPEYTENPIGFANLRSLTLNCEVYKKDTITARAVLWHGFQVKKLQLHHLALRFYWKGQKKRSLRLPVLNVPFLRGLCEGPVANSLLMCDMKKESATPNGLPLLEKLTSLAAGNAKIREEMEGRGPWQRQWKIIK